MEITEKLLEEYGFEKDYEGKGHYILLSQTESRQMYDPDDEDWAPSDTYASVKTLKVAYDFYCDSTVDYTWNVYIEEWSHTTIEHIREHRKNMIMFECNYLHSYQEIHLIADPDLEQLKELYNILTKKHLKNTVILTEEIFESAKSINGGLSQQQLDLFGFGWTTSNRPRDWKRQIVGKVFKKEIIDQFINLKNVHLNYELIVSELYRLKEEDSISGGIDHAEISRLMGLRKEIERAAKEKHKLVMASWKAEKIKKGEWIDEADFTKNRL